MSPTRKASATDSPTPRDPSQALASAEVLLQLDSTVFRSRSAARLLRHALELAVDDVWAILRPGEVLGRSTRARQIRLLAALDRKLARETYAIWCMLSDAARPHIYELPPSQEELRSLQARTRRTIEAMHAVGSARTEPASGSSST